MDTSAWRKERIDIGNGDEAVYETVRRMIEMIREGLTLPMFKTMPRFSVKELFEFAKIKIRYRLDPLDAELIGRADRTIERGEGDCDDKVIVLATALRAAYPDRKMQIVIGACKKTSNAFSHVWLELWDADAGKFITLDPTPSWAWIGWQPDASRIKKFQF